MKQAIIIALGILIGLTAVAFGVSSSNRYASEAVNGAGGELRSIDTLTGRQCIYQSASELPAGYTSLDTGWACTPGIHEGAFAKVMDLISQ